jgi:putative spermidine/putrescine transport system substrate-binding protein
MRAVLRNTLIPGLVVASLALAACGGGSKAVAVKEAATSGDLNVIGYAGIWQDAFQKAVLGPFHQKYPSIKINYSPKRSSSDMLASLRAEGSRHQTDLAILDKGVAITGNQSGMFQKVSATDVPNLTHVKKQFTTTDGYGPVIMEDAVALLYDKKAFSQAPDSWNVLWDPAYKQKVAIMAPPSTLGLNLEAIVATMQGEDFTKSTTQAITRLKQLSPNVQSWMPTPDEYQTIITGQTVLSLGQNARGQYYADRSSGKLGVTIPKEGTVYQINTINLAKDAPHSAAAKTFMNYELSPEAQAAFAKEIFYAPSVDNVALPADVASRVVATEGSQKIVPIDLSWFAGVRANWTQDWKRQVIGN